MPIDSNLLTAREPADRRLLVDHITNQPAALDDKLRDRGAVVFRGFEFSPADHAEQLFGALNAEMLTYTERSSPRTEVADRVYTATDYPARHPIPFHNENSYQMSWPRWLLFYCENPAETGGETLISDVRTVAESLSADTVEDFAGRGWSVQRNFGGPIGLDWQTVFQTDDRAQVEQYCASQSIECEWLADARLRTRASRSAFARHPESDDRVWFNHAAFFNVSSLDEATSAALLDMFEEDELPSQTYYGDGERIPDGVLTEIRTAYDEASYSHVWTPGDVMIVDNMRMAHARRPFTGDRRIMVAMAGTVHREDVEWVSAP